MRCPRKEMMPCPRCETGKMVPRFNDTEAWEKCDHCKFSDQRREHNNSYLEMILGGIPEDE